MLPANHAAREGELRAPGVCERAVAQQGEREGGIVDYDEGLPEDRERAYGAVEVFVRQPVVGFEGAGGWEVVYVAEEGEAAGAGGEGEGGFAAEEVVEDICCEEGCEGDEEWGGHGEGWKSNNEMGKERHIAIVFGFKQIDPASVHVIGLKYACLALQLVALLWMMRRRPTCSGVVAPTRKRYPAYQTRVGNHISSRHNRVFAGQD